MKKIILILTTCLLSVHLLADEAGGTLYQQAIDHIKDYEGFRSKVYYDTDSSRTIGYGHHLRKGENFTYVDTTVATMLLRQDLNRKIQFVKDKTGLTGNKALALGMFAFNVGTGTFSSALKKGLLHKPEKLLLYCNYRTKNPDGSTKLVKSQTLFERRQFELNLFNHVNG